MLLARFFKIHPGHLVEDPQGYHTELASGLRVGEGRLEAWLLNGAEQFAHDAGLSAAMRRIAGYHDTRKCLLLLDTILETPDLAERLTEVLQPPADVSAERDGHRKRAAKL